MSKSKLSEDESGGKTLLNETSNDTDTGLGTRGSLFAKNTLPSAATLSGF